MGIGYRERNFTKYLANHFGISLPTGLGIFYAKGVRIGNKDILKSDIHGELGYAACDFGFNPTNALVQNFGHLAGKNVIDVEEPEARAFAAGKDLEKDLGRKAKQVIIRYGPHAIGLGFYEPAKKKVLNRIPEKRRRIIINSI